MKKFIKSKIILIVNFAIVILLVNSQCQNKLSEKEYNFQKHNLDSISEKISGDFFQIRQMVEKISRYTEKLYLQQDKYICKSPSKYQLSEKGVLYKPENDGGSAVFVSGFIPINEEIRKIVCFTEPLDSIFKSTVSQNSTIIQAYYNDKHSYNRIFPYFDILLQVEAGVDITKYNFYYLADKQHNPEKKSLWINEPYVDPAGRGWVVSTISPVYLNNELVGVSGLDVTTNEITNRYLEKNNRDIILFDSTGVIIAADETIVNILGLPLLKSHKYFENIKQDTYLKEDFNILKNDNEEIRDVFNKILKENAESEIINIKNETYQLIVSKVKELNWFMVKIILI